jgi:hypothetical protein
MPTVQTVHRTVMPTVHTVHRTVMPTVQTVHRTVRPTVHTVHRTVRPTIHTVHHIVRPSLRTLNGFYVNTETETAVEIFYRNIRTVSNKQTELSDNVCSMEFQIMFLTETSLNDICFDHKLFPVSSTTFRSDRVSSTEYSSAAVLTADPSAVGTYERRYDLQFFDELSRFKFPP